MTTYTVVDVRGTTVLPASDAGTAALYYRFSTTSTASAATAWSSSEPETCITAHALPLLPGGLAVA